MDQQRSHVNKFGGDINVELLHALHIGKKLRRDAGDGNVVDIDILLADEVEQKVERALVNLRDSDGKREVADALRRN